jgi:flagellar transcriptional activator FlhC
MKNKSVVSEGRQIQLAIELINLGARLQVLESETSLSRERLLKLYKEVKGESPSKGMLPFSADWFLSWQPNIHSSLFVDIYRYLLAHTELRGIHAVVKAYRLYLEHVHASALEPILTFTRAWTLVRFLDVLLQTVKCKRCAGTFIAHHLELNREYVCGLCRPPSRAGKSAKRCRDDAARSGAALAA